MNFVLGFFIFFNLDYKMYYVYIDEVLFLESLYLYGLYFNVEIGFLIVILDNLFCIVFEMQLRDVGVGGGGG